MSLSNQDKLYWNSLTKNHQMSILRFLVTNPIELKKYGVKIVDIDANYVLDSGDEKK